LGFYAAGLLYANKHLTDGVLPKGVVRRLLNLRQPEKVAQALVDVGLWEVIETGYQIHDYQDYNPTAMEVRAGRDWDKRRKQLYSDPELIKGVRARDQNRCRYCAQLVDWKDRRGPLGGQFDHVIPRGPNTLDNIVVACRGCNNKKRDRTPDEAGMTVLPPGSK
jgi:hypothetical protein